MKYYKGTCGDFVVKADNYDEGVKAINRRILAVNVPLLAVEEVDMDPAEAEGYGTLEEPKGPWVGVEVYGLLVQGVHIFWKEDEAEAWFKKYTGFEYGKLYVDGECMNDDYDQTSIFTLGER